MAEPTRPDRGLQESKDFQTGYRHVYHDFDVPDRQPHEPHGIRVAAQEYGTNKWTLSVIHGPHETEDANERYKHLSREQFEGPLGKLKPVLKRTLKASWGEMKGARG